MEWLRPGPDAAVHLADYGGSEQLATALQAVLDDSETSASLRDRAHRRARDTYSWDAIAHEYETWFVSLAGQSTESLDAP